MCKAEHKKSQVKEQVPIQQRFSQIQGLHPESQAGFGKGSIWNGRFTGRWPTTKQALSGMLQCEVISEMYFRTFLLKYEVFFKKLHRTKTWPRNCKEILYAIESLCSRVGKGHQANTLCEDQLCSSAAEYRSAAATAQDTHPSALFHMCFTKCIRMSEDKCTKNLVAVLARRTTLHQTAAGQNKGARHCLDYLLADRIPSACERHPLPSCQTHKCVCVNKKWCKLWTCVNKRCCKLWTRTTCTRKSNEEKHDVHLSWFQLG